jgi:hypothetical protein
MGNGHGSKEGSWVGKKIRKFMGEFWLNFQLIYLFIIFSPLAQFRPWPPS